MQFEIEDIKVHAKDLTYDDHIILKDQLWRVVNNFPVIGGAGRMLQLAYYTHRNPSGFKFHPVTQSEERFEVLREIQ